MLAPLKKLLLFLFLPYLLFSCKNSEGNELKGEEQKEEVTILNSEQQSAFDAMNTLQVFSDDKNRLYSTFPDIVQPCYPPDTSLMITQSQLLEAMQQFIKKHFTNLNLAKQNELATIAVLAQDEYKVLHCRGDESDTTYEKGIPKNGTWVLPNILGRRDFTLVW